MADELDRIRVEYRRRAEDPRLQSRYSLSQPGTLFCAQCRERDALTMLRQGGFGMLSNLNVLEVGCGEGGVLFDLIRWGAEPGRLHGCDLLPERVAQARHRLPADVQVAVANGGALPYPSACFDLVLQFTVFTSVLDEGLRRQIAAEMWRVLRPGGAVLWYDFRYQNRNNTAVRAINPREARSFFPAGRSVSRRVTLAPPIARRLAPLSWLACALLDRLSWLRTHDMILIQKMEA